MAWDDDKKAEVIAAYTAKNPTPENSMEIVKEIAEEFEESPNGVRVILSKAEVYVKKVAVTKATSTTTGTRVSKAAAAEALVAALADAGQTADMDIIDKLTGKAAQYFTTVVTAIND
jgi:hypothetical protein